MADNREKPLHELLSRDMVDIYVGPENTHWILHEKLLCYRSAFFRKIFYGEKGRPSRDKAMGLPDEDDEPFKMFVGWLYSGCIKTPTEEKDLTNLFDLYLMGDKWAIKGLVQEVLDSVRDFYHRTETYPGLRRVQYIYANTEQDSPMRHLLVNSVARYLTLAETIPQHWDKALRKNGQLAVDIIKCIQEWHLKSDYVPDAREMSVDKLKVDEKIDEKKAEEQAEKEAQKQGQDQGQGQGQGQDQGQGQEQAKGEMDEVKKEEGREEKPTMNGVPPEMEDKSQDKRSDDAQ